LTPAQRPPGYAAGCDAYMAKPSAPGRCLLKSGNTLGNPYDGHTLAKIIAAIEQLVGNQNRAPAGRRRLLVELPIEEANALAP
jgi:hypothetical protein